MKVDDYKYALEFVAKEKQKIQQDDQVHALESQLGSLQVRQFRRVLLIRLRALNMQ